MASSTPIGRQVAAHQVSPGGAAGAVNVGDVERWLSVAGGTLLGLGGLRRGGALGLGLAAAGGALLWRGLTGHCSVYGALGVGTGSHNPAASVAAGRGEKVTRSIVIHRPAEELFRYWRDFENLPRFMHHLASVHVEGNRSRWTARGPARINVSWDAEVINEEPNRLIAWRSLEGSQVDVAGSVHFIPQPDGRSTEVRVTLKYDAPGGRLGRFIAWMSGETPGRQIEEDLRCFKELMEAHGVPTTEGRPRPHE